jgi:hypothetical protein
MARVSDVPSEHRDVAERLNKSKPDLVAKLRQSELNHRAKVVTTFERDADRMSGDLGGAVRAHASRLLNSPPILEHKKEMADLFQAAWGTPGNPADVSTDVAGAYSAKRAQLKEERAYDHDFETAVDAELNKPGARIEDVDIDSILGYQAPTDGVTKAASKRYQSYRPGLIAGDVKKGATGWCQFCEQPVNTGEYRELHWRGRCLTPGKTPSKAEVQAAVKAAMERHTEKVAQLRKDIADTREAIKGTR